MGRWDKTCYTFKEVRSMIHEGIETTEHCMKIMSKLECCCDELTPDSEADWGFYDDFRDLKYEIHEEMEYMEDEDYDFCENAADSYLREFYDLCDEAYVWLEL